jgi:uncharacterized membrane protein required for colicin V production
MFTIIGLVIALACCLWGIRKDFVGAWMALFNLMFSIYLAVVAVALTGKYLPASLPNQWAKAGELLLVAIFLFILLHYLSVHLFDNLPAPDLPKYFDTIGAGVCGFLTGYIFFWFIVYIIAITPVSGLDFIKKHQSAVDGSVLGRSKISAVNSVIEFLSLQVDDGQSEKIYHWLETPKAKFTIKKTAPCPNSGKPQSCTAVIPKTVKTKQPADPNSEPNSLP